MALLSDDIEQFIAGLIDGCGGQIELRRNELAQHFSCAPSQINYVLATRFSPERGYVTRSRRGGGGYILVLRFDRSDYIAQLIAQLAEGTVSEREALNICEGLAQGGLIDEGQRRVMSAAVSDRALNIPANIKDIIRTSVLKEMLTAILKAEV